MTDVRLRPPTWDAARDPKVLRRLPILVAVNLVAAVWYFGWLIQPARVGHLVLYGVLLAAEMFNLVQAFGFWWTSSRDRLRPDVAGPSDDPDVAGPPDDPDVDVFVPTYGEPVNVVEPTIAAASGMRGARVRVHLLDDGRDPAKRELADRYGVCYVTRPDRTGAKAGNINHALRRATAPYVAVFDADHVPDARFCERTLGHFADSSVAFVQTPQYYANASSGGVAAAAWAQQALFFGAIARGKDSLGAMFCCGTNVVFRREALADVGGFPESSLTEDFELSIHLHERGWRSVYVPEVLAAGLGPEDMAAYVGQQQRWARGCLSAISTTLRARLPWRLRLQYLLSSMFFLSGWTFLVYMALPVIRIFTGAQPVDAASADQFLLHFGPYFAAALGTVAFAGGGSYTFAAFSLMVTNFWIHLQASVRAVLRRSGRFVVTPKEGVAGRQPRVVVPALLAVAVLATAVIVGLVRDGSPATLNNVAFASLHISVLLAGARPALVGRGRDDRRPQETPSRVEPTASLALEST